MTRAWEETAYADSTEGVKRGLSATGGVITSAGIVLTATFAALAILPIPFLTRSPSSLPLATCWTPWWYEACWCRRWPLAIDLGAAT